MAQMVQLVVQKYFFLTEMLITITIDIQQFPQTDREDLRQITFSDMGEQQLL